MSVWFKNENITVEKMDTKYFLKHILETQKEILKVLKNIDNNILNFFGDEEDKKLEQINKVVRKGHFVESQRETLKELIKISNELPKDIVKKHCN